MARPKTKKTSEEVVKEVFEKDATEARKARLAIAAKIKAEQEDAKDEAECRAEFKMWWAQNRLAYKRDKDLEEALWIHAKSIEMTDPSDFQAAVEHFGLKRQ